MITLPNTVRNRATFRILIMAEGSWTSQAWTVLVQPAIFDRTTGELFAGTALQGGYELDSISRWCLPDEDRAQFHLDYGIINTFVIDPLDLHNKAVRIQVYDDETFPNGVSAFDSTKWKTVFVGTVIHTKRSHMIGPYANGRMTYFCAGVLSRTRKWPLDRHSTADAVHAKGHPGYNVPLHGLFRKVLGNKGTGVSADPFGDLTGTPDISSYYTRHRLPIDGVTLPQSQFTDEDAVKHALASSRATGEPKIQVDLSSGLFNGTHSWSVSPGDTCWDLLRRVCNRQRGRGSVFLDYTDDVSDKQGPVLLTLKALPSNVSDLTWRENALIGPMTLDLSFTIKAAASGDGGAINVDINGDHRVVDNLEVEDRQSSVYDAVVVQGECIQVLCNLNFYGSSLGKRWSAADESAFNAIPLVQKQQRTSARWRQVYRRFGIPDGFNYQVTNEAAGTAHLINYYCDSNGDIKVAAPNSGPALSSTMTVKVLPDLPVYEGWRYDSLPPTRYDGASNDYLPPPRMAPVVMYQADTNNVAGKVTYLPLHFVGFNIQVDDFGFYIVNGLEDQTGVRMLAPSSSNSYLDFTTVYPAPDVTLTSGLNLNKLNTIVGLELGTRVSIQRYDPSTPANTDYNVAGRRMTMTINGLHLWLGAPNAIWELDYLNAAQNQQKWNAGLQFPTNGGANIAYPIRDDRGSLSFIAALAWEYFGRIHNPGTWTLRDCGFLTSFATQTDTIAYPTLGQLVGSVTHTGLQDDEESATLNTPISSIHYDHLLGETTWRTDYISYDGNTQ